MWQLSAKAHFISFRKLSFQTAHFEKEHCLEISVGKDIRNVTKLLTFGHKHRDTVKTQLIVSKTLLLPPKTGHRSSDTNPILELI